MVTLEDSRLFSKLSPEELKVLRESAEVQTFSAGQQIFKEGDVGDGVYVVREGLVEISCSVGANMRHVFSEIGPGDIFGEMAVVENQPRSACAVARKESSVFFFPRGEILKLVERSPVLSLILLREISHRLREFNHQYVREVVQNERLAIIGRFARTIVHDLKNPLNIIGLTAEVAAMEHATLDLRRQATADIRKQVERITDMIGEILDFTQGSHPDTLLMTGIDYAEFVEHIIRELRAEATLKSVQLELENSPPSVKLQLNPKRLWRVFENLVTNATDAMIGGGKITIRFRQSASEVITEIEDTGPGIAPEIAGRLFEPFATYGKMHGTGLGLTISKRIMEDHRGWLSAVSRPGPGALFMFGLPLKANA